MNKQFAAIKRQIQLLTASGIAQALQSLPSPIVATPPLIPSLVMATPQGVTTQSIPLSVVETSQGVTTQSISSSSVMTMPS